MLIQIQLIISVLYYFVKIYHFRLLNNIFLESYMGHSQDRNDRNKHNRRDSDIRKNRSRSRS